MHTPAAAKAHNDAHDAAAQRAWEASEDQAAAMENGDRAEAHAATDRAIDASEEADRHRANANRAEG